MSKCIIPNIPYDYSFGCVGFEDRTVEQIYSYRSNVETVFREFGYPLKRIRTFVFYVIVKLVHVYDYLQVFNMIYSRRMSSVSYIYPSVVYS